jgi:outer membrane protein OmpA-like peptidoglycan-associated protein
MKLKTMVVTIVLCGASQVALAADINTEQTRGATSGLVIGALAGGPAGAFAGAVIGGEVFGRLFGVKRINRELESQVAWLEGSLESERESHRNSLAAVNHDLDTLLALQAVSVKSQKLPIQFRTASTEIEAHYEGELMKIARLLTRNRDASVVLTGYSDRRGDEHYNLDLSKKRVARLEQYLLQLGASRQQIVGIAHGESQPLDANESLESNFFDRRVMLELNMAIDPQLATR